MAHPETLALLASATYAGGAKDRKDFERHAFWVDACTVFRNALSRRKRMEKDIEARGYCFYCDELCTEYADGTDEHDDPRLNDHRAEVRAMLGREIGFWS